MSLKHIMLGLLGKPHSGYDIKKQFEMSLRNFWRAELSQIYPLLQKMENEGLLSSKEDSSAIGPPKRVYTRAAKGSRELQNWLNDGPTVGAERVAYLAQVYFLNNLNSDDDAIAFMQELRDYMQDWLITLEVAESDWSQNNPLYPDELPDEDFYPQLTLSLGLRRVRASLEWCEESIRRIEARRERRR